ncbi:hypothetical protein AB0P19_04120 [Microbacterium oleivorans]|uniref:hypothetical protein n=1 Tax=Microbacterium TaxID=33882 RepID=UPI0033F884C5
MTDIETFDVSKKRIDLGSGVSLPSSWCARVTDEDDVPGAITVRAEWDSALGRSAVVFVSLERGSGGIDITSQNLREIRTHWILTRSAMEVVTVDEGTDTPIPVHQFLAHQRGRTGRTPEAALIDAVAIYRVAGAISFPPLKLVADTLHTSQSTATRLMDRARTDGVAPEVRLQEPRRAPAVDPFEGIGPFTGHGAPTTPSIGR